MIKEIKDLALEEGPGRARLKGVNSVCALDHGILYCPADCCSKTGPSVIEILRRKQPEAVIPWNLNFNNYADTDRLLEFQPVYSFKETITKCATHL